MRCTWQVLPDCLPQTILTRLWLAKRAAARWFSTRPMGRRGPNASCPARRCSTAWWRPAAGCTLPPWTVGWSATVGSSCSLPRIPPQSWVGPGVDGTPRGAAGSLVCQRGWGVLSARNRPARGRSAEKLTPTCRRRSGSMVAADLDSRWLAYFPASDAGPTARRTSGRGNLSEPSHRRGPLGKVYCPIRY